MISSPSSFVYHKGRYDRLNGGNYVNRAVDHVDMLLSPSLDVFSSIFPPPAF
jgi:hypothetical protein